MSIPGRFHQKKRNNRMDTYQSNIRQYQSHEAALSRTLHRLSTFRLVAFVGSAILITVLANERLLTPLWVAVPLCGLGLGLLIKRYNRVAYRRQHTTFLQQINQQEVLRQENRLAEIPLVSMPVDREHPYVADLDIFGSHSLFQLINRATTESGHVLLATWLSEPASQEVIRERQQAIRELTPRLAWRQDFQASGMHFRNPKSDYQKLLLWIEKPVQLLPHQSKYLMVSILLSVLSTGAAAYWIMHVSSSGTSIIPLLIILLVNFFILNKVNLLADKIIDSTHENIKILGGYQSMITTLEAEEFDSELLQRLQATFRQHRYSAVGEINQLRKILEVFQLRGTKGAAVESNKFYPVFNIFWLLDIYWIILTERWKRKNGSYLRSWAAAVSEFEMLSSLAGFAHANPTFTFPEITQGRYTIHFEGLGHPLISPNRVCNDFTLEGRGEIAMITGSNMAGKSTFLRTVGVNLVLAFLGAPCCAELGQVSPVRLFTSMRTQDDLEAGISSFYAELRRVEQLLSLIARGQPVFFLLDEMFKGTNSQDRHRGGFSLIKQLSEINAFGIISTHDLALAELTGSHHMATNFSFNSAIRAGEMTFNYTLTPGLCQDFNASELMKKSGIKILSV